MRDLLRDAALSQWQLVQRWSADPSLRPAMIAIWLASFGGAIHEPVTPYFYRALGVSDTQIGDYGLIRTVFGFVLTPLYGWLLDHGSAYWPLVLSCFFCAFGCLTRGFAPQGDVTMFFLSAVVLGLGAANLWTVAGAYVACANPKERRTEVLSGFTVQVTTLALLGKMLYRPWDWAVTLVLQEGRDLGMLAEDPVNDAGGVLLRYRVHMAVCTFFCIGGFFNLLGSHGRMRHEIPSPTVLHTPVVRNNRCHRRCTTLSVSDIVCFGILGCSVGVVSFASTTLLAVWPYFVQDRYAWSDKEFAHLVLLSTTLCIFTVALAPAVLERRLGKLPSAAFLMFVSAVCCFFAFPEGPVAEEGPLTSTRHFVGACVLSATLAAARPPLESLASLRVPRARQGLAFGVVATLAAVGQMTGNAYSLRLYSRGDSALPFHVARVVL
eukprot:Hpha_TRINITY_DN11912_c0_g2::TRINITY_DN11912_c0_g2_i2::g.20869::m.20869